MKNLVGWGIVVLILALVVGYNVAHHIGCIGSFGFYGGGGLLSVIVLIVFLVWAGVL